MEELMTESEQLIKDKPLSKFLKDSYNFKLQQYEKTLQYKEIPLPAYQFKKEEENKFFLTNEMVDNSFANRDVEEAVQDIKPPLEKPPKKEISSFNKRRPPKIKWQPIEDELNNHKKAKMEPLWQINVKDSNELVDILVSSCASIGLLDKYTSYCLSFIIICSFNKLIN